MRLKLKRVAQYGNSVMGQLWKEDPITGTEEMLCDTLENNQYIIPEGEYRVDVTHSPKFGRLLPILCSVPGRSGIRIHAGNTYKDSTGCILVGKARGAVLVESRRMEERLTKMFKAMPSGSYGAINIKRRRTDIPDLPDR